MSTRKLAADMQSLIETGVPALVLGDRLARAIELFSGNENIRLVAVTAPDGRPIGALYERDIRRILFTPYGHALFQNSAFDSALPRLVRECPIAEADRSITALVEAYAASGGSEGMILTTNGRYSGLLSTSSLMKLAAQRELELAKNDAERFSRFDSTANRFHSEAAELAAALRQAADILSRSAAESRHNAAQISERGVAAAQTAEEAITGMVSMARNGRSLADELEQLLSTIEAARRSRAHAFALITKGVERARSLTSAANEIADVSTFIQDVSKRVNLLALNATIEAARAGEAGRGFSVVAGEVKALAGQTRAAALGIADRIDHIRGSVALMLGSHEGMEAVIGEVDELSLSIERAIADQTGNARAMACRVDEVTEASAQIRADANLIEQSAAATIGSVDELNGVAGELGARAARLHDRVGEFVSALRAA
ncbi:MAG: chemotaxis protein [Sphingomonadaceae bacterium]|nr:chemotaxis protein [Sphingomonadaceae bacterium]